MRTRTTKLITPKKTTMTTTTTTTTNNTKETTKVTDTLERQLWRR